MVEQDSLVPYCEAMFPDPSDRCSKVCCYFLVVVDVSHEIDILFRAFCEPVGRLVYKIEQFVGDPHRHYNGNPGGNPDDPEMIYFAEFLQYIAQSFFTYHKSIAPGHKYLVYIPVVTYVEQAFLYLPEVDID